MNQRNILIIVLMLVLFFIGFFSAVLIKKNAYDEASAQIQQDLEALKTEVQRSGYLSKKVRTLFNTVEQKHEEIAEKDAIIQEKEKEIMNLSYRIANADPAKVAGLQKELEAKNKELDQMRQEVNQLRQEAQKAQKELAEANKIVEQQTEKITKLEKQLKGGMDKAERAEIEEEIGDVREQLTSFQEAAKFEYQGDTYTGRNKRRRQDQNYYSAYYFYLLAGSEYDMARVYSKIQSQEIIDRIDQGMFSPDDTPTETKEEETDSEEERLPM